MAVAAVAPLCRLVVWTTGYTDGLREIHHLIQNIPPRRLLLWLHVHFGKAKREQREAEWQCFLAANESAFSQNHSLPTSRVSASSPSMTTGPRNQFPARPLMPRSAPGRCCGPDRSNLKLFLRERLA